MIFEGTIHAWDEGRGDNAYHIYLPIYENYLIYLQRKLHGIEEPYEFCRAERASNRAASVCSQSARIMANLLTRNKIKAQIITLEDHVIVRAKVEKKPETWWILDADYGVVIEQDIDQISKNPEIIRAVYAAQEYDQDVIEKLVQIYAPPGNQVTDDGLVCRQENYLYVLKWLIPVLGSLPQTIYFLLHWTRKSRLRV